MNIQIMNPAGAFKRVADFRTGVDPDGEVISYGGVYLPMRANAAIARGALVSLVVPTATQSLSVKERVTGDLTSMTVGIAMEAATAADVLAGKLILVCIQGHALVNVGAGVPAAGNWGQHSATTGIVAPTAAAIDATIINGDILGVFLGTKDANNRASFWFQPR